MTNKKYNLMQSGEDEENQREDELDEDDTELEMEDDIGVPKKDKNFY